MLSNRLQIAQSRENKGFQALVNGNYNTAIASFQAAENAYPAYHNVYELARILRQNQSQMIDPAKKKEVFQKIVKDFSYGAPPDLLAQIKTIASQ